MVLIDTNVLAYLLIEGEKTEATQRLRKRDPDWRSEGFIMVEFTNVLASYVAARRLSLALASELLHSADALLQGKLGRIPHAQVLTTAARLRVTAYDARFLVLAQQLGTASRDGGRKAPHGSASAHAVPG
ncbi:MAG: type II toxin-antitoxin system VapC family toxin [Chthoniobacterales bacterium]